MAIRSEFKFESELKCKCGGNLLRTEYDMGEDHEEYFCDSCDLIWRTCHHFLCSGGLHGYLQDHLVHDSPYY